MVSTLRVIGLTHVSLGNHEQDLRLNSLRERLEELSWCSSDATSKSKSNHHNLPSSDATATTIPQAGLPVVVLNTNMQHDLPPEAEWMRSVTQPYSLITSRCGKVRVALLGLLSDEPGIFRDNTFKSVPIQNVLDAYTELYNQLVAKPAGPRRRCRRRTLHHLQEINNYPHQEGLEQEQQPVDLLLPLTHESVVRDKELAQHMLSLHGGSGVIIGGHEHDPYHKIVVPPKQQQRQRQQNDGSESDGNDAIHILKSGMDARNACLVDLVFEMPTAKEHQQQHQQQQTAPNENTKGSTNNDDDDSNYETLDAPRLVEIKSELIDLSKYQPSPFAQEIVDKHMSVVQALEDEIIIDADSCTTCASLPPGVPFSSQRARFQQTTIGGIFCQMIKEELEECDVAMLNGAVIKADTVYENAKMSYAQLKNELPFPTKMVVVEMTLREVNEAIHCSRTAVESGTCTECATELIPRRGYLQVDCDFDLASSNFGEDDNSNDDDDASSTKEDTILRVALPRNLLNGFCKITPLMTVGERLKEQGRFPGDDDFVPAIDLIVRHASKNRWLDLVTDDKDFDRFDSNDDGVLEKHEIKAMVTEALGYEPADFVVDDMVGAIDVDGNGAIDHSEFGLLLAQMERDNEPPLRKK